MRKGIAILLALGLALGVLGVPASAEEEVKAREPEATIDLKSLSLLAPFKEVLSGPVWLVAQGLDPRLGGGEGAEMGKRGGVGEAPRTQPPAAAALVPYRDPSPKFSRNILIPQDFTPFPYQTEPHLAVNPKDPDHLLVGMIDYNFPNTTSYVSQDGGATWEGPFQIKYPLKELASAGDPTVAFDREGRAYFSYISLDIEEFVIGNILGAALVSSIVVARSEDGGFKWGDPIPTSRSQLRTQLQSPPGQERVRGEVIVDFMDKPWMSLGPNPQDAKRTMLYATYTKFTTFWAVRWLDELPALVPQVTESVIELVASSDGGTTWSKPLSVSPKVRRVYGEARERFVQGSQSAVGADGTLHVAWFDTTTDKPFEGLGEVWVARSTDGGQGFSAPKRIATFQELPFRPRASFFRNWASAFPQIATGPGGEVYVLYAAIPLENPDDDGDIYFVRSLDKGESWARPKKLSDDDKGRLQFFPAIAVSPQGVLHAIWGDMRNDPIEARYHIYYASSENRGESWAPNARVTDFPSNPSRGFPGGRFIGDYFTIQATENDVYMAWADTRLGEFGGLNQKIAFARKRLMPNPSLFISPPTGPGGQDVVIQGHNFEPNQDIFLEVGGAIVATVRAGPEGRFSQRLFIPISGEGAHAVRAMDASGNTASGSFFMDFGFGNIKKMAEQLAELEGRTKAQAPTQESLQALNTKVEEMAKTLEEIKGWGGPSQGTAPGWLLALTILSFMAVLALAVLRRRVRRG